MHPANPPLSGRPTARWHPPFDAQKHRTGFTLIELLVVVSILAMLATVAMLQLARARIIAYEEIALTSLRLISRACHFFFLANQRFPDSLTDLGAAVPPYIPSNLIGDGTTVTKQGYVFTYAPGGNGFTLNADPQTPGKTGTRYFFVNEQLIIRMDLIGPADSNDPPIP